MATREPIGELCLNSTGEVKRLGALLARVKRVPRMTRFNSKHPSLGLIESLAKIDAACTILESILNQVPAA